jgi:energy-converting hydrogenase Eha subunit G
VNETPEQPVPDPAALRVRVLLTAALTLALFLVAAYAVAASGLSGGWLIAAVVVIYLAVMRPLMRPVRDASRLRRSLAYQAFLDSKDRKP